MLGRFTKLFLATLLFETILSASDLSPKYLRLFTDENGSGSWQMVGVAGFYNNVYGVEYSNVDNQSIYTSFYCEEPVNGSIIRTKESSENDVATDMIGRYWLFSIKVEKAIGSLSPLVVDVDSSDIHCENVQQYSSDGGDGYTGMAIDKFIYRQSGGDEIAVFKHPTDTVATLVFSLMYDENRIYEVPLSKNREDVYLGSTKYPASTNEFYKKALSEKKQPINQIVDLYMNDNPGFGDGSQQNYYSNYDRELRDYVTTKHQVSIDGDNALADESELRIYSYDSMDGTWLDYSNKNSENDFNELQAGKGYWMKFNNKSQDFNEKDKTLKIDYIQTLELNDNYGKGTESNLTLHVDGTDYHIEFIDSDIDSIVESMSDANNFKDSNGNTINLDIGAVKTGINSILVKINYDNNSTITIRENSYTGSTLDIFANIPTTPKMFWTTKEIKSGLVLGDTSVTISSNSVYRSIATQGWNLLTLPTSTIRRSVTGIVFEDWEDQITDVNISDPFGVNNININLTLNITNLRKPSGVAKEINKQVRNAMATGELSTQTFNIRAYPIGDEKGLAILSDDEFLVRVNQAIVGKTLTGTNLIGIDQTTGNDLTGVEFISQYGDYALLVQPNLDSEIVQDGYGKFEITAFSVGQDGNDTEINKSVEKITIPEFTNESNFTLEIANTINKTDFYNEDDPAAPNYGNLVKAYPIDSNFSGKVDNDEYLLLVSKNTFYIQDATHTKTYTYDINQEGDVYVGIWQGNGVNGELLNRNQDNLPETIISKEKNLTSSDFNGTKKGLGDDSDIDLRIYIVDENGSTIEGNQTEYVVVNSDVANILLVETITENNVTQDSLSLIKNFNQPIAKGSLLNVFQGNGLAKLDINDTGYTMFSFPENYSVLEPYQGAIQNLNANSISTSDLLARNALITLSEAFADSSSYLPTMIVGSETSSDEGRIYWKSLSPVRNIDRWYEEYNLFSTHNQKAYWVYLDEISNLQLDFEIIKTDTMSPSITKNYIREFNNETGITSNYFNLTVKNVNVRGIEDELSGYVTVNLHGINEDLETFDFPMQRMSLKTTALGMSPYQDLTLDYFEIEDLSSALQLVTITATDGRLSRDEFNLTVDVKKPTKPSVTFKNGDRFESTKLFIQSGDKSNPSADDTNHYMIFKNRINDEYGVDNLDEYTINSYDSDTEEPLDKDNYIMSVAVTEGEGGVDGLCPLLQVSNNNLDYFDLSIVALDNENPGQANVSDIATRRYVPMRNVHVLVSQKGEDPDQLPTVYDNDCVKSGTLSDEKGDADSGVSMVSLDDETVLTYTPMPGASFTTTTPKTMFIKNGLDRRVAKIKFVNLYYGKNFFVYNNGKLYKGVFLDGYHNEENPYEIVEVENSGQTIGED
jgi:hypothetical protein